MATNQKANVSTRSSREDLLVDKLLEATEDTKSDSSWLYIVLITGSRVLLQLCSVFIAYGIGIVYASKRGVSPVDRDTDDDTSKMSDVVTKEELSMLTENSTVSDEDTLESIMNEVKSGTSYPEPQKIDPESIREAIRDIGITQDMIAAELGTSKGTVSTAINNFKKIADLIKQKTEEKA